MKKEAPRKGGFPHFYVQFKTAETRRRNDLGNAEMLLQMR